MIWMMLLWYFQHFLLLSLKFLLYSDCPFLFVLKCLLVSSCINKLAFYFYKQFISALLIEHQIWTFCMKSWLPQLNFLTFVNNWLKCFCVISYVLWSSIFTLFSKASKLLNLILLVSFYNGQILRMDLSLSDFYFARLLAVSPRIYSTTTGE